jgi:hypothetical protein
MTVGINPLHKSNLEDMSTKSAAIIGSGLLINPTGSLEILNLLLRCTRCYDAQLFFEDSRPLGGRRGGVI